MKIIQILEFIYRWGLQHQLNKNDNIWKFKNKTLPLSSQIDCENGAQYKFEGVILRDRCSVRVRNGGILNIGNNVAFNNNCTLTCRGKITIGSDTNIGPNCAIFDHDHDYMSKNRMENYKIGSILIGKNVWIGANVTILKNSVIGDNCVIGAGSVVKGKYHSNTLVVGNPAVEKKVI